MLDWGLEEERRHVATGVMTADFSYHSNCTKGSQRDVVYLGWPIAPSYMSPNAGGIRGLAANEYSCAHGAQINFGDLTPYLTYELYSTCVPVGIARSSQFNIERALHRQTVR